MGWEYKVVSSIAEASGVLTAYQGQARVIAAGTDLMLDLWAKKKTVKCLVDITKIGSIKKISCENETIFIGAGVTFQEIATNPQIREKAAALAEAASLMGSPQIRNTATIVGNIVNAQPAADAAVALMAFDAELELASAQGEHYMKLRDCYESYGNSAVDSTMQIVTGVRFKLPQQKFGSAFVRFAKRKSLALPVLNAAVCLHMNNDAFLQAQIIVAPAGPRPFRAIGAEAILMGQQKGSDLFQQAALKAADEAPFRSSPLRGDLVYRRHLAAVLINEALEKAFVRAKRDQEGKMLYAKG